MSRERKGEMGARRNAAVGWRGKGERRNRPRGRREECRMLQFAVICTKRKKT